jgi:hypothetical protein
MATNFSIVIPSKRPAGAVYRSLNGIVNTFRPFFCRNVNTPASSIVLAQGAMNAHSAYLQLLSNRGRAITSPVHFSHGLDRHSWLPTFVQALHFSRFDTSLLTFQNELTLHLGNHTEHGYKKRPRWVAMRDFGSVSDYEDALKKGMNATAYRSYKSQISACRDDWQKCADNEQLVDNYRG